MNQPIKTALSASIKKLLREAEENTCSQYLEDDIAEKYADADGVLRDGYAQSIITHLDCLHSMFYAYKQTLEIKTLTCLASDVLDSITLLNKSFLKLCEAANNVRGIPLNGYGVDYPLYLFDDGGPILEAIGRAQEIELILADLRELL